MSLPIDRLSRFLEIHLQQAHQPACPDPGAPHDRPGDRARGQKRALLHGICPEVVELLKDKHISSTAMAQLKKMSAGRQIEAAELMLAANNFTTAYARALLAATPRDQLMNSAKTKQISGVSAEQMARTERQMANLQRDLKLVEDSYGGDVFNLVLARGYLAKLFSNPTVTKYLDRHQPDIAGELRDLIDAIGQEHTGVV